MPLYDFKCTECTDPHPKCEECGEPTIRIISSTSFALKGDGWYKDGYSKPQIEPED
jgi:putative FmdB family regulatory protein